MTRSAVAALALLVGAGLTGLTTGCTADSGSSRTTGKRSDGSPGGSAYRLVAYRDCESALDGLRDAARRNLPAWGYQPGQRAEARDDARGDGARGDGARNAAPTVPDAAAGAPAPPGGAPAPPGGAPAAGAKGAESSGYSGTNTHEVGVDEPDLVKTDGKRIITVQHGVLRVIDTTQRSQVASLKLATGTTDAGRFWTTEMLLAGDKVLLIGTSNQGVHRGPVPQAPVPQAPVPQAPVPPDGDGSVPAAPQLLLVDLAGNPRVLSKYAMTGNVVDARQVGTTVRVVMRSAPQIPRPLYRGGNPDQYATAMLEAINRADVEEWLPRYTVDTGGTVTNGRVDCSAVAHPTEFSAASMLTVLTFDLGRADLGNGDPITVAADGDTVYSNGPALYVANDQRWRAEPAADAPGRRGKIQQRTEIYKFDTSKPGRPAFVGGGAVDGWLLNQYSMSDWNGHLRVATTTGFPGTGPGRAEETSESTVSVLRHDGKDLTVVGQVGGLGKGERIYSVRFVAGTGYVVTFRQTDPLYTVDLRDPARPKVTGELKITGYSAYLHPAGEGRLLGIGQEANDQGRVQGMQVSLFDVSDPAAPKRLAQHHVRNSRSEAEFDPHAFLYWPQTGLLVVPLTNYRTDSGQATSGALALRVGDGTITELGLVEHPGGAPYSRTIRRSLVIESTLWTVSQQGLLASDVQTAARQTWVPFT